MRHNGLISEVRENRFNGKNANNEVERKKNMIKIKNRKIDKTQSVIKNNWGCVVEF